VDLSRDATDSAVDNYGWLCAEEAVRTALYGDICEPEEAPNRVNNASTLRDRTWSVRGHCTRIDVCEDHRSGKVSRSEERQWQRQHALPRLEGQAGYGERLAAVALHAWWASTELAVFAL
jgi:hypothetical protein